MMETMQRIQIIRTENPQSFKDHTRDQWQALVPSDTSGCDTAVKRYKHCIGYMALLGNQPVGLLTFATDFALFGHISGLWVNDSLCDENVAPLVLKELIEAVKGDAITHRMWRISANGINDLAPFKTGDFKILGTCCSEWKNPQFTRDMAMAL